VWEWSLEQVRSSLRESDEGAASVHLDPAALDGVLDPGLVLGGRALDLVQERPIDLLDVDAAILHGLDAARDLDQLRAAVAGSDSGLA
jgi:hypothetical protein